MFCVNLCWVRFGPFGLLHTDTLETKMECAKVVAVLRPRKEVPWMLGLTVHETTLFFLLCMILYFLLLNMG